MCSKCFSTNYFIFNSQTDFENFDKELNSKLKNNLTALNCGKSYKEVYFDQYQCLHCMTIWNLSTPDNAWRGFFIDNESISQHIDNIKNDDKKKGLIGLLILIIIVGIIVYLTIIK